MRYSILLLLLFPLFSFAQQKADISALSFISGNWQLAHEWGDMEETWSLPKGDNMMGAFRCVSEGKVVFYEFIVIEQTDSVPVMKLRHFNPGSIGWEDKDTPYPYPLVSLTANKAVFERPDKKSRLTYERTTAATMVVILDQEEKGQWQKEVFNFTLAKAQ